jgi:dTMP kinase
VITAARGRLIALEGIDGCGKSTQAALLAERISATLTHEPGATELGRALRSLVLSPSGSQMSARAEALVMAADRAQHVAEIVHPALEAGRWVVTDRYSGSTLAYQGYGRGLDPASLKVLVDWAAGGVGADLSVLVDVPPAVARRRLAGTAPDRLEGQDEAFFDRVRRGFLTQAAEDPRTWVVIDGDRPVEEVATTVLQVMTARLGDLPGSRA